MTMERIAAPSSAAESFFMIVPILVAF